MKERLLGIIAVVALLYIAYHASLQTTSGWVASAAERGRSGPTARAWVTKRVRDADVVVGRPHDGIAALRARRAHLP
jgi:hypothetical protein